MKATTIIAPPKFSNDLWDEVEQAYYTVRLYKYSGIGVEQERLNVLASSEQEAKDIFCGKYPVSLSRMYCLYAFKQDSRV
jgi:hypothetical protein